MKEQPIEANGQKFTGTTVLMGNPHLVIFVEDIKDINLESIGPKLENHPLFPDRINVEFAQVLEECRVGQPEMPLYSNRTGAVYEGDPKPLLSQQIASPVRWETIVRNMIAAGADTFVELGPGKTLCGLIEKIDKTVKTYALSTQADLETILKEVKGC